MLRIAVGVSTAPPLRHCQNETSFGAVPSGWRAPKRVCLTSAGACTRSSTRRAQTAPPHDTTISSVLQRRCATTLNSRSVQCVRGPDLWPVGVLAGGCFSLAK